MTLRYSTGLRDRLNGINTELVSNGTFTSAATGWTASTATLTGGVTYDSRVGVLQVDTAAGYGYQEITTVRPGHWYRFSYVYQEGGAAGDAKVTLGTSAGDNSIYDSGALTTAAWTTVGLGTDDASDVITFKTGTTTESVFINLHCTDVGAQYYDNVSMISMARSIQDVFNLGQIEIYTGTQPSSADAAPTGTRLVIIKSGSNGVTFDDSASGVLTKAAAETWSGVCEATGTAGWGRVLLADDSDASSTTDPRIDFAIATSGSQMNFSSTSFTNLSTQTVTSFQLTLPAS